MMTIAGFVDFITSTEVSGWAYDEDDPKQHVVVSIRHGRRKLGTSVANEFRTDLRRAGIGAGDHAFLIAISPPLTDEALANAVVIASAPDGERAELPISEEGRANRPPLAQANSAINPVTRSQSRMLSRYGTIYAESADLLPPVGLPADFIDQKILDEYYFWTETEPEKIKKLIVRDTIPIPHSDNREGYAAGQDLVYWLSGYGDYRRIERIAGEYGIRGGRFLDFGGSTGRVFRHFVVQTDSWDVWSCDFKISSVEFNLQYYPSRVRVFLNTALPSLPLSDGSIDLISGCSVFTHIDETETGWLLELRRTLKPGGIACLTIQNDASWAHMEEGLRATVAKYRPDIAAAPNLPEDKVVVTFRQDDPYNCIVFHRDSYIRRNWGRFFEICEIRPLYFGEQAMVVCRRVD